jgi:hypothetical protein
MVGRRWGKILAVLATVGAVLAIFAAAASAEGEEDTGGVGAFRLKGTNGYSILVMAFSRPHFKNGEVVVWATKKDASVTYLTPAAVTATTIDADLGAAGTISVDFEASGPEKRVPTGCSRPGTIPFEPGDWIGTIELAGEEGFTRVQTTRAKAIVNPFVELVCGGTFEISELSGHGIRGGRLVARSAVGDHTLFLQVNKNRPGASVRVEASLEERGGDMVVNREVVDRYPAAAFSFDPLLRSAAFAPAAPFAGSARFHRDAKPRNQWTGNLTVDLPGRADVSLAGSRFHAALVRAERREEELPHKRSAPALSRTGGPKAAG